MNKLYKVNKVKISPLAYIVKSTADTLIHFPDMNSSLSSKMDSLIYKDFYNIGIAIDTEAGLIVPNIKDVNNKMMSLNKLFFVISMDSAVLLRNGIVSYLIFTDLSNKLIEIVDKFLAYFSTLFMMV